MAAQWRRPSLTEKEEASPASRPSAPVRKTDVSIAVLGVLLLLAIPLAIYRRSLSDFFMLDDFIWLKSAASHGFFDLMRRETSLSTPLDIFEYPTPYVRPLVDAYFWVTWRVFGTHPAAYHALAIAIHACAGALVAAVGWQLGRSRATGWAAGLLFVALPSYDMAVTWISEATDLLYALFYLLSLALFLWHLRRGRPPAWAYAGSLAAFTLALLSKEPAITLAPVAALAVLIDTKEFDRTTVRRRALDLVPYFALAAFFYLKFYRHEQSGLSSAGVFGLDERFFSNYWDYLRWLTFPFGDLGNLAPVRLLTALGFLTVGSFAVARRDRPLAFVFLWTLIALVPLAFFDEGLDRRYTYLASAPFAIFLALGFERALSTLALQGAVRTAAAIAALAVALPILAQSANDRQDHWHRQAAFYEALYYQVPAVCGPVAPGGSIYVVGSPAFDFAGLGTQVALNFSYDRVEVLRAISIPDIPLEGRAKAGCIAYWDGGRFVRGRP